MKKLISKFLALLLIISLLGETIYAEGLVGEAEVKECIDYYLSENQVPPSKSSIVNPLNSKKYLICQGDSPQKALYQAIMDILFTEVDLKIENYLENLEGTSKPTIALTDLQLKMGISGEKGTFFEMYNNVCGVKANDGSIYKYAHEFIDKNDYPSLNTEDFTNSIFGVECQVLFRKKLDAYYEAGEVIIKREVINYYEYARKEFLRLLKDKYHRVLFKLIVYVGQLKVLSGKWYENTLNPSN